MSRQFPSDLSDDRFLNNEEGSDDGSDSSGSITSSSSSSSMQTKDNQNQHQSCCLPRLSDWSTPSSCSVTGEADAGIDRQGLNLSTPDSGRETLRSLEPPSTPTSPCLLTPNPEFPSAAVRYDGVPPGSPYLMHRQELHAGEVMSGREESIVSELSEASSIHKPYGNTISNQFHAATLNVSCNTLRTRGTVGYIKYGLFRKNRLPGENTQSKANVRKSVWYKNNNIPSNKVHNTMRTNDLCIRNSLVSNTTGTHFSDAEPGGKLRLHTKKSLEFLPFYLTKPPGNYDVLRLAPEAAGLTQPSDREMHGWACDHGCRDDLRLIQCHSSDSTRTLPPLRGGNEMQKPGDSRYPSEGLHWARGNHSYGTAKKECLGDGCEAHFMCRRKSLHVVLQRPGFQQTEDGEEEELDAEMGRDAEMEVDDDSLDGDLGEGCRRTTTEDEGRGTPNANGSAKEQVGTRAQKIYPLSAKVLV